MSQGYFAYHKVYADEVDEKQHDDAQPNANQ